MLKLKMFANNGENDKGDNGLIRISKCTAMENLYFLPFVGVCIFGGNMKIMNINHILLLITTQHLYYNCSD